MNIVGTGDEPSMDDILACVRRILAEEAAERARARAQCEAGAGPLVLTNMVAVDGSIVPISPAGPRRHRLASARPARDGFAELDVLKVRVAALLAIGRPAIAPAGRRAGRWAGGRRGLDRARGAARRRVGAGPALAGAGSA